MTYRGRVLWKEGMLLSPHHLQQQDNYHEQLLLRTARALAPFPWGLTALSFDPHELAIRRVVVITECKGFLPDGTVANIGVTPGDEPPLESAPVRWPDGAESLDVVLALAGRGERPPDGLLNAEYAPRHENVVDQTGPREIQVEFMRPALKLLLGNEFRTGYESIKLAELRNVNGKLSISEDYVPPILTIEASPFYRRLIDTLLNQIRAKRAEALKIRNTLTEASIDARVRATVLLGALGDCVPVLNHLRRHFCHPERLYVEVARFCGALAEITGVDVPSMPDYDHQNAYTVFSALGTSIARVLDAPLVRESVHHSVFHTEGDHWVAEFPSNRDADKKRSFYLGLHLPARNGESGSELQARRDALVKKIVRQARICAANRMMDVQKEGHNAIDLRSVPSLPASVASDDEYCYLELDQASGRGPTEWPPLETGGRIALWFPKGAAPAELELELWVS